MPPSSSWSTVMAPFIFFSASLSALSTVTALSSPRRSVHERSDGLARQDPGDVALLAEVEHQDGQVVVATQRDGGGIHHLEAAGEHLGVLDGLELVRIRMVHGVGVVDAVDLRPLEDGVGVDL